MRPLQQCGSDCAGPCATYRTRRTLPWWPDTVRVIGVVCLLGVLGLTALGFRTGMDMVGKGASLVLQPCHNFSCGCAVVEGARLCQTDRGRHAACCAVASPCVTQGRRRCSRRTRSSRWACSCARWRCTSSCSPSSFCSGRCAPRGCSESFLRCVRSSARGVGIGQTSNAWLVDA